jgi:spore coat protein CotH
MVTNKLNLINQAYEDNDAKQLKTNDVANESDVPIYKAEDWSMATLFRAVEDTLGSFNIWMGWEQKHPKPESESHWWPLYSTIDFIANSSDTDFANKIYSHITKESLIDYYILLNITKALDNVGKNIILSRNSKDNPFYICPWDLDLTYELFWDGSKINYSDIISNNIYDRLFELNPEDFCAELKRRWNELAIDILSYENISSLFEEYESLFYESGAFTREIEKWPEPVDVNEIEFIKDWTENRLEYLRNHFNNLN